MTNSGESAPVSDEAVLKLFRPAELSLDRLPGLKGVFDGLAADFAIELCNVLHYPASIALDGYRTGNLDEFLSAIEGGIAYTYRAPGWANAPIIVGVDHRFVFSMVDAMYGYDESEEPSSPGRKYTPIEIRVVQRILDILLLKVSEAFETIAPTDFSFDSLKSGEEISKLREQSHAVASVRLALQLPARTGSAFLFIPMVTLANFRDKLATGEQAENAAIDLEWERQLTSNVSRSIVKVRAAMDGGSLPIKKIMALEVGSILELPAEAHNAVALHVDGTQIGECTLAKSRGQYAVRIRRLSDDALDDNEPECSPS